MADNPEQRRMQALLRFATEAGSHGNDPSEIADATRDPANRNWLNEALQNYAAEAFDPVNYLKQQLTKVFRYMKNDGTDTSEEGKDAAEIDQVYEALEGISDNCDQCDLAKDFHKIGGFDVMLQCLQYKDSGICWRACDVLATCTQNHEYCQNSLIEMKALPIILRLVDDTSVDNKVREKAFYALSCLVRGNEKAMKELEINDGYSVLIRAMQANIPRVKIKSVFFVKSLCESDDKYSRILHQRGIEQQIVGMLRNHEIKQDSPENLNIVENLLGCLFSLVSTNADSKVECQDTSFGLSQVLRQMKEKFFLGGGEYQDCIKFCDKIMQTCFYDEDIAGDR